MTTDLVIKQKIFLTCVGSTVTPQILHPWTRNKCQNKIYVFDEKCVNESKKIFTLRQTLASKKVLLIYIHSSRFLLCTVCAKSQNFHFIASFASQWYYVHFVRA